MATSQAQDSDKDCANNEDGEAATMNNDTGAPVVNEGDAEEEDPISNADIMAAEEAIASLTTVNTSI